MTEAEQQLAELANGAGRANGAMQSLVEQLQQVARASGNNATAATASAQKLQEAGAGAAATRAGMDQLAKSTIQTITGFASMTSSVYGADKAFTSVIPTLDMLGNITQNMIEALGKLGSGVSIMGFSIGRASEGLAALANAGFKSLLDALKFQLEGAQKVTDAFLHLGQVGAIFGGSLGEMAKVAAGTQTPIAEFAKAIMANVESISKLGAGMSKGGQIVVGMAKNIYNTNDALVALYGNVGELTKGTADYLALQSQLGINVMRNTREQEAGAREYLLRQKELSAITGKNAETLKREEEGRRRQLDYNLKLGRLGDVARENVKEGMAMSAKIFGDEGAKYAEEYFATGGKVYTKEALAFQAMNQEAADTIGQFMSGVDTDAKTYRDKNAKYLSDNAGALEAWARSLEDMAEINRAAQNPLLRQQTETASSIIANLGLIQNATKLFAQISEDRTQLETGKVPDKLTQVMVDAERERSALQRKIDEAVLKNMDSLGLVVSTLNKVTLGIVEGMGVSTDIMKSLIAAMQAGAKGLNEAEEGLKRLNESMGNAVRNRLGAGPNSMNTPPATPTTPPATPTTPPQRQPLPTASENLPYPNAESLPSNLPQRATGGITTGPTTVGERGAEAVIPLTNGSIPLKVDLSQLVQAMAEQTQLTKDVIRELQDSNDLTKKLIDYTA